MFRGFFKGQAVWKSPSAAGTMLSVAVCAGDGGTFVQSLEVLNCFNPQSKPGALVWATNLQSFIFVDYIPCTNRSPCV